MNAPFCPITRPQAKTNPLGLPTKLPSIPLAYDLPSLIRSVNIMRDILRTLTTSLTVNNTYMPRPIPQLPNKTYLMSSYPDWRQEGSDIKEGFVFHKTKDGPDKDQRAYISRTNMVEFRQPFIDNDKSLMWRYLKALDSEFGDSKDAPIFEEDFFERVVNVNFPSVGTEIKPGGMVYTSDNGAADSKTILISVMFRVSTKVADEARSRGHVVPIFMFGKYKKPGKKTVTPKPKTIEPGIFGASISFMFFNLWVNSAYDIKAYLSVGPGPGISGGPSSQELAPVSFGGGLYPTWSPGYGEGNQPNSYFIDDQPPNITYTTFPTGQRYGIGPVDMGSYTWTATGQALSYHLVKSGWSGGEAMTFAVTSYWTYEFDPITVQDPDYEVNTAPAKPSIMYYIPGSNSVQLSVAGRPDQPKEGDRWGSGTGSGRTIVKGKWNHVLMSGDIDSKWRVTVNGIPDPGGTQDYHGNPEFAGIAVSALEFGLPLIPSNEENEEEKYTAYDIDYIAFRVWFGGHFVDVHDPEIIALFVDENYKPVRPGKAEKKLGQPDVFLDKGAKNFIKNKGTAGQFNATGFTNGKEGLVIDYKPYPKFVGTKDTSKPSPANQT